MTTKVYPEEIQPGDTIWFEFAGDTGPIEVTATVDQVVPSHHTDRWDVFYTYTTGYRPGFSTEMQMRGSERLDVVR